MPRFLIIGVAAVALSLAVNAASAYQPLVNYQLRCMGCHLADGSGQPGRVPSMRRSLVLFSASPEGRDYVIRVPGVAQLARNLSDLKVAPAFVDYSEAEIHRLRDRPLVRVNAVRARLLKAAGAKPRLP